MKKEGERERYYIGHVSLKLYYYYIEVRKNVKVLLLHSFKKESTEIIEFDSTVFRMFTKNRLLEHAIYKIVDRQINYGNQKNEK